MYPQDPDKALRHRFWRPRKVLLDTAGNLAPAAGIFPDHVAPIIRKGEGATGSPQPPAGGCTADVSAGQPPPIGVTNIRNVTSIHWRRWLDSEHRCLVPFTSFSELDTRPAAPRNHPVCGSPWARIGRWPFSPGSARNGPRSGSSGKARSPQNCSASRLAKRMPMSVRSPQGDACHHDPPRRMAALPVAYFHR